MDGSLRLSLVVGDQHEVARDQLDFSLINDPLPFGLCLSEQDRHCLELGQFVARQEFIGRTSAFLWVRPTIQFIVIPMELVFVTRACAKHMRDQFGDQPYSGLRVGVDLKDLTILRQKTSMIPWQKVPDSTQARWVHCRLKHGNAWTSCRFKLHFHSSAVTLILPRSVEIDFNTSYCVVL
jgi:hypothetical protein